MNARCEAERTLAARATGKLRQLIAAGGLELTLSSMLLPGGDVRNAVERIRRFINSPIYDGRRLAMKVSVVIAAHGPIPAKNNVAVTLDVELDQPEHFSIGVVVPSQGSEADQVAAAVARAKQLARAFADS
jgi:hypothetical protein